MALDSDLIDQWFTRIRWWVACVCHDPFPGVVGHHRLYYLFDLPGEYLHDRMRVEIRKWCFGWCFAELA
jgi:hypothetical protein